MSIVTIFVSGEAIPQTRGGGLSSSVTMPSIGNPIQNAAASPVIPEGEIIQQAPDGLFYIDAKINGMKIHFVVDTGSSVVILNAADAARAGVATSDAVDVETAAGAASMHRAHISNVVIAGKVMTDVEAAIVGKGLPTSLMGQNVLTQLGSVTLKGDQMAFD